MPSATPAPRRIGLFGGTFDPIHDGHLHLAGLARNALALDKVRFIPCRISPHKEGSTPTAAGDRVEMLHRALDGVPWAVVDERELTAPEPSYSYLTAQSIAGECPGARLFWIMGNDQWRALSQWMEPEILASLVEFIVLARHAQHPAPRPGCRLHVVHGEHPASATTIREAARAATEPLPWLNPQVASWIRERRLYQNELTTKAPT
jgi:nicotinate-nucleotide adenylyltransferase